MATTHKLVLVRHGQSTWNLENRFTGWTDVDLTELGRQEALAGAKMLRDEGFSFDAAYTSVLRRAIKTLWIVLETLELEWIPVTRAWQLNERHYGGLQGLNKAEMAEKFGETQVKIWRRSYDVPPPPLELDDPRHPRFDRRYASVGPEALPCSEALRIPSRACCPTGTAPLRRSSARASVCWLPPTATVFGRSSSIWITSRTRISLS